MNPIRYLFKTEKESIYLFDSVTERTQRKKIESPGKKVTQPVSHHTIFVPWELDIKLFLLNNVIGTMDRNEIL